MEGLRKILEQAEKDGVAIGHFNISDLITLKAVFEAARNLKVPVIVGVSEGERQWIGVRQISAMAKSLREEHDCAIFLNADHTRHKSVSIKWTRQTKIRPQAPVCALKVMLVGAPHAHRIISGVVGRISPKKLRKRLRGLS
jgi:Fructose-bisphosphate aldolase class-II